MSCNDTDYLANGDFLATVNTQCVANIPALMVLWIAPAVLHVIVFAIYIYLAKITFEKYKQTNMLDESRTTVYTSTRRHTVRGVKEKKSINVAYNLVFAVTFVGLCGNVTFFALCVLKASNLRERNVGTDVATTVVFLFGTNFWWMFVNLAFIFLIRLQMKNAVIMDGAWAKRLKMFKRIIPFLLVCAIVADAIVCLMLIDPSSTVRFFLGL